MAQRKKEPVTKGVANYSLLGWKKQVHSFCPDTAASVYYSVVDAGAGVPFDSYIEYSHLHSGVKVGHNCIVSGVELFSGYIPRGCSKGWAICCQNIWHFG